MARSGRFPSGSADRLGNKDQSNGRREKRRAAGGRCGRNKYCKASLTSLERRVEMQREQQPQEYERVDTYVELKKRQ
jgi:hypothetical protein